MTTGAHALRQVLWETDYRTEASYQHESTIIHIRFCQYNLCVYNIYANTQAHCCHIFYLSLLLKFFWKNEDVGGLRKGSWYPGKNFFTHKVKLPNRGLELFDPDRIPYVISTKYKYLSDPKKGLCRPYV